MTAPGTASGRLTAEGANVLSFVRLFIKRHGWAPTVREIAKGLGFVAHTAAHWHLVQLELGGFIARGKGARAIRVLSKAAR